MHTQRPAAVALQAILAFVLMQGIYARLLSNPFNSNNGNGNNGQGQTQASSCTILASQKLVNSNSVGSNSNTLEDNIIMECELDPSDAGYTGCTRRISGTTEQLAKLKEGLTTGQLRSGVAKLNHGPGVSYDNQKIFLPPGLDISTSATNGNNGNGNGSNNGNGNNRSLRNSHRHLQSRTIGDKSVLAVRVTDVNGLVHADDATTMSDNDTGLQFSRFNTASKLSRSFFKMETQPINHASIAMLHHLAAKRGDDGIDTKEQLNDFLFSVPKNEVVPFGERNVFDEDNKTHFETLVQYQLGHPESGWVDSVKLICKIKDPDRIKRVKRRLSSAVNKRDKNFKLTTTRSEAACSFNKLNIVPGLTGSESGNDANEAALGVIEVNIDIDITAVDDRLEVRNAIVIAVSEKLGFNLPGPYDHVLFLLEKCYGWDCGWAAYAYINSWNSVFQGDYYAMASVQVHELGHNFNLAHSGGLDGSTYTDHSCSMGEPIQSDDAGRMCYNPSKNWQLDWYDANNGKLLINPTDANFESQLVTLVGIAEYDIKDSSSPVAIKLETGGGQDFFLAFNRATGINADNVEADNEVTIIQVEGGNGEEYSQSYMRAHLMQGESYVISGVAAWNGDLTLSVASIKLGNQPGTKPGTAVICITKTGDCSGAPPSPSQPSTPQTSSPTKFVTASPVSTDEALNTCEVASIATPGDTVTPFGCTSFDNPNGSIDGTTNSFQCEKDPAELANKKKFGIIITPPPERHSIVQYLRVYATDNCDFPGYNLGPADCNPSSYKVEGKGGPGSGACFRVNNAGYEESNTWRLIRKGDLNWQSTDTNAAGPGIVSSYSQGDSSKNFAEVDLLNLLDGTESECGEYRLTFSNTRDLVEASPIVKFGEVELVGKLTSASVCPTSAPTTATPMPTTSPTSTPTASPTSSPKPSISSQPSLVPSISIAPSCAGTNVASVLFSGDSVTTFGCSGEVSPGNAIDGTTNSFECVKNSTVTDDKFGVVVTPAGGLNSRTSIVELLRVYANADTNGEGSDPVQYKVEGRGGPNCFRSFDNIAESSTFRLINKGDLTWSSTTRNTAGESINSTYSSGDASKTFVEVDLVASGSDCSEYRITFGATRVADSPSIKVGEVELVGRITSDCPSPAPFTSSPTASPTRIPTTSPTLSAKPSFSSMPSLVPSISIAPTCLGTFAASVILPTDSFATFGCSSETTPGKAYDGTTDSFECMKDNNPDNKYGIVLTPPNDRPSIVEALRVYATSDCGAVLNSLGAPAGCDPIDFKVEGRGGPDCFRSFDFIADSATWRLLNKGDLMWSSASRNTEGKAISSNYTDGDPNKNFVEVSMYNNVTKSECSEYRITFGATRTSGSELIRVGEVELVGRITECQTTDPPTTNPTTSPKPSISTQPSLVPSISIAPTCGKTATANVLALGDTFETFGCSSETTPENAYDGKTNSFECVKDNNLDDKYGIIVTPGGVLDSRTSIVEKLRVYANTDTNGEGSDPVQYKVEGRGGPNCFRSFDNIAESSTFRLINKGDLTWSSTTRNTAGESINSTYSSGDMSKTFVEVDLIASGSDCSEYRITFSATRVANSPSIKVGEVELVGQITSCTTSSPTNSGTKEPSSSPTHAPTSNPTNMDRCMSTLGSVINFDVGDEFSVPAGVTGGGKRPWALNTEAGCDNTGQGLRAGEDSQNKRGVDDISIYTINVPAGATSMSYFYSYPPNLDDGDDFHVVVNGNVVKEYESGSGITCGEECVDVIGGGTVEFICKTRQNGEICSIDQIQFYN